MKACHNLIPIKLESINPRNHRYRLLRWNVAPTVRYRVINGNEPGHPKAGENYGTVHKVGKNKWFPASKPWGYCRDEISEIHAAFAGYRTRQAAIDALVGTHLNPYADPDRYKL